ncbi:MAG: hypothetical protein U9N35_09070 [Euryarchaeota archaeon]|nr:hypothetical protein [Euryarchaeota archaeon]
MGIVTERIKSTLNEQDIKLLIEIYLLVMLVLLNFALKNISSYDKRILLLSFSLILVNSLIFLFKFEILTRAYLREIITSLFQISLVIFLLLLLASQFRSGIKEYANINYFLVVVILLGVYVFFQSEKKAEMPEIKNTDYYFIVLCGIVGAVLVWYKVRDLGNLAYLISALSGVLIVSLSYLLLKEEEPEAPPAVSEEKPEVKSAEPSGMVTEKAQKEAEIERFKIEDRLWEGFVLKVDSFVEDLENAEPNEYFELYRKHTKLLDFYKSFTGKFGECIDRSERKKVLKKFHYCSSVLSDLLNKL